MNMRCRFCGEEMSCFRALKAHVAEEHPVEAQAIAASLPPVPSGEHRFGRNVEVTGVNVEFRKRMGYSSRAGNGPVSDEKRRK